MNKKIVTYEQFGAVGDGKHDDFIAIYKTHEYANANGFSVKAREGATYYVEDPPIDGSPECVSAIIMTDVDWTGATFKIDDRKLETKQNDFKRKYAKPLFKVTPSYPAVSLTEEELRGMKIEEGQKKIDLGENYRFPALIIPECNSGIVFRRPGYANRLYGEPTKEIIVIDRDGNVREDTPVIYNYREVSALTVYRIDETPITLKGGTFITIKPECDRWLSGMNTAYVSRGLLINRSNVTVVGMKKYSEGGVKYVSEYMTGEKAGCAYAAFYTANYVTDVTFKDCVMTAQMSQGHSSYAHSANFSNKIVYDHCTLSNFWVKVDWENDCVYEKSWNEKEPNDGYVPSMHWYMFQSPDIKKKMVDRGAPANEREGGFIYWGSGGSNFCKNLEMINGTSLSRFDAHQGLYNGKIVDSVIDMIALTGTGSEKFPSTMLIENSTIFRPKATPGFISLRGDYGSTWQGDIIFRNVDVYADDSQRAFFNKSYKNWYFGYETYVPNFTLDNVSIYKIEDFSGSSKTKPEPIDEPFGLFSSSLDNGTRMHLKESHVPPQLEIRDRDGNEEYSFEAYTKSLSDGTRVFDTCTVKSGDGYVDEPFDIDGDGKIGPFTVDGKKFAVREVVEYLNSKNRNWGYSGMTLDGGGGFPKSMLNFNITHTPAQIKIINNKANHKFRVPKTAGLGVPTFDGSSDMGGFFGNTKFYYTDSDYLLGTDYSEEETENTPFIFT